MRSLPFIVTGLLFSFLLSAQSVKRHPPDHVPGRIIVHYNYGQSGDPTVTQTYARFGGRIHAQLQKLGASVIDVTPGTEETVMQELRSNPSVRDVELDHYAFPAATPNDPDFSSEWHLAKIQAPAAWGITTGSTMPIAVLDSGVDTTHPDLTGRLLPGWNFVTNNSTVTDTIGHGTAVIGVVGAVTNNGLGVSAGVWQNPILPVVVVDSNSYASYSNIAAGIQYAADHGARVISLSVGGSASSTILQSAVDYAWNLGAVVVAAAMNNASSTPYYPAACNHAIAVSATDQNDNLASFSDYGNWIALSAPGTNILTTSMGGGYQEWQGTSLATPVVASVAALALAADPSLTAQQLVTLLEQNADDLGPAGYDNSFGWGRVNAYRTVEAAKAAAGGSAPAPAPPPTAPATSSLPIRINAGGGAYTDTTGVAWAADTGYSGGAAYGTGTSIAKTPSPVLYQTCRYGSFGYTFAVPNGSYTVTLKFAELSRLGIGLRLFNVSINSNAVLSNFDIYAAAGGGNVAVDKSFPVTVTGGRIAIQFTSGAADLPLVNGIDIEPGAAPPASSANAVRINAGGGAYTDPSGLLWLSDNSYSGGTAYIAGATITNTSTPALYQSCRYGNFSYAVEVPNGTYNVILKFAELSRFGTGLREFNVAINSVAVLSNFDIYAAAGGGDKAIDKSFPVTVSTGWITIQFTSGAADLPLVNAIDIEPGSSTAGPASARVNSGGSSYTDGSGLLWLSDNGYSGGTAYVTGAAIANTSTPELYQTARYGNFSYAFAVPDGSYNVTLKFAELTRFAAGLRQFNASINSVPVLSNFDIYAQAGGADKAIDKTFPVTVSSGWITIQFTSGAADLPLVSAIDIEPSN